MQMPTAKIAPYGSWKSPITSDLLVAQTTMLSDVRIDGDHVYWLEGRPQEQGRNVIVRAGPDGVITDITPAGFNVRTRVHEYGGAPWLVAGGTCIFSNFADQRLYLQRAGQADPEPLTPGPSPSLPSSASAGGKGGGLRYGDGVERDHAASRRHRCRRRTCGRTRHRGRRGRISVPAGMVARRQ